MFSKILLKIQDKTEYLYNNSLFLQQIDKLILLSILFVFITSTFLLSDYIGFTALITMFLTFVKILTKKGDKLTFNSFEIFLMIYFMFVVISLAGSTLFALSFKGFLKTFIYVGFYFSVAHHLKTNLKDLPLILGTIAVCISFESVVAFLQNFSHVEEISTWQDVTDLNPEQVMTRVYGTLKPLNPNLLGGYFVVGIPSAIGFCAYLLSKKKYLFGSVVGFFALLSIISLFETGCRGAYIALMFILLGCFLISAKFFWKQYKQIYLSMISVAVIFFTLALMFITSLRTRFLSIFAMRNDSSNSFRFNVYQSSLKMFTDNWLLGIGVGNKNFREIYGLYMKTGFDALSAYNIFLEIAVESGIFALISFLGFIFICVKDAIKIILNSKDFTTIIFVSIAVISIVAVMLHGFVDTVFFRPQIQFIFWTMVAIVSASKTKVLS